MPKKKIQHIGGVKITGGKVEVGGDLVGHNKIVASSGISGDDLERVFSPIYQLIEARSVDPKVDKQKLSTAVNKIQKEVQKGDKANSKKVEKWLVFLADMAMDIFEVTVAALNHPIVGISTAIKKIIIKAKDQQES